MKSHTKAAASTKPAAPQPTAPKLPTLNIHSSELASVSTKPQGIAVLAKKLLTTVVAYTADDKPLSYSYSEVLDRIHSEIPSAKTTEKSLYFHAKQLRAENKLKNIVRPKTPIADLVAHSQATADAAKQQAAAPNPAADSKPTATS